MAKEFNLDKVLKAAFEKEGEQKMKKVNITIRIKEFLNEDEKAKISNLMEELSIKAADRKKYFENGEFFFLSSTIQKYDEYVKMFGELTEVTYEEIPPTVDELIEEYFETHKDELKGENGEGENGAPGKDGKTGADGKPGKDASWVKITICLAVGMVLLSLFFARVFRPDANDIVTDTVSNVITEVGNKAIDGVSARAQGAIRNIEQAEKDAVAKLQGVTPPVATPPVQNPPAITPPVTQTPAPSSSQFPPGFVQEVVPGK